MIEVARQKEKEEKLGISYYVSDTADLSRSKGSCFDVVTCFIVLVDTQRYEEAISGVARNLCDARYLAVVSFPYSTATIVMSTMFMILSLLRLATGFHPGCPGLDP
jgi:2-polyprenyl-3-methyl-5-hydroxy-6-metoxy-1,4-benzoquinol methylase